MINFYRITVLKYMPNEDWHGIFPVLRDSPVVNRVPHDRFDENVEAIECMYPNLEWIQQYSEVKEYKGVVMPEKKLTTVQFLDKLEKEMLALSSHPDKETGHIDADELLLQLVERLSFRHNVKARQSVDRIIELYTSVPKWYS